MFYDNQRHNIVILLVGIFTVFFINACRSDSALISLFPLDRYDQQVATWIKPSAPDYDYLLMTTEAQQNRMNTFYKHYFGEASPWNTNYVTQIINHKTPDSLKSNELEIVAAYKNTQKTQDEIGYGENFSPYSEQWIETISSNINFNQFDQFVYQDNDRAIVVDNLEARVLPTDDVHFYSHLLAGQGYPFDNLQMSALWAGTPVYILGESQDHAWSFVITPDYIAWVKTIGLARVNQAFVRVWSSSAKKHLVAITKTQTSIVDNKNKFRFLAYVGAVFPGNETSAGIKLLVPVADENHNALVASAWVSANNAATMPITATPHHFANIIETLIGRPYGWGNMYFYNDCSAEMKSLYTPFGIWLPRHSSDQVLAGKMVDMSRLPAEQRIAYLMEKGRPFTTLIYIGGHVIMYVGNYPDTNNTNTLMAMTYQNLWGLSPSPSNRRAVIGKAVLFPMLLKYPEDTTLHSLANKKYFQVARLDDMPDNLMKLELIDLKQLMNPS